MLSSIYAAGLTGIARGMQGIAREAHSIATSAGRELDVADIARSLVEAKRHEHSIEASAKAISLGDRAIGHLIDELV
jgi:hypothetical protein